MASLLLLEKAKAMKRTILFLLFAVVRLEAEAQVRVSVEPQEGDQTGPASPLNEIVAVGLGQGLLTLATPVDGSSDWRYRTILLHPADAEPAGAALSRSGTKVLVDFGGLRKVVDLSRPTYSVSEADPEPPPSHRLPRQVFPSVSGNRLVVLDDLGAPRPDYPPVDDAAAAAAHDNGTILYATTAGVLSFYDPIRAMHTELGFRVPAGDRVHILGGSSNDPFRFLLVLEGGGRARIVDPLSGTTLAERNDAAVALMEANLILAFGREHGSSQEAMSALVSKLRQPAPMEVPKARGAVPQIAWTFFHVLPDVSLYAPILEMAGQERVFPASVQLWEDLRAKLDVSPTAASGKEEVDAYLRAYLRTGDARREECTMYERVSSYSGSWLIEYWIYYLFDVGGLEPHPHDSEHLFIEVDKLGGTVAALFGGAHGMLAPNNTYLILDDKGYPLELPLFGMVELGKHATAPDVNRDGIFTPGLDENYFKESAKVWGIRDAFGTKDTHFLLYDGSMMAPRLRENWLGVEDAATLFPGVEVAHRVCKIESFRREIENGRFEHPRSTEAANILKNHEDARDTRTIFKPWVFPRSFIRAGVGNDRDVPFPAVQVAYVTDIDRIPFAGMLPGRLAFDVSYAPRPEPQRLDFGVRYERLVSNLFGFYAGLHQGTEIESGDFDFQDGLWFSLGPMVEVPLWRTNFLFQAGAAFREDSSPIFEFRIAFGIYQPSRWFWGIKKDQKTPY